MALETMNELHFTSLQVALDTHLSLNLRFDNHQGKKTITTKNERTNKRKNQLTNKQATE